MFADMNTDNHIYASISADIVASTSLSVNETIRLKRGIEELLGLLEREFPGFWGRLIKGDYIECILPEPRKIFRIALILKTYIKAFDVSLTKYNQQFVTFGIRISIGIGGMRIVEKAEDIMDGKAIYLSGRGLEKANSTAKGTMTFCADNMEAYQAVNAVILLTDALINDATRRQCNVLYYKLLGMNESDIALRMGIRQPAVSQHSKSAKWYCVEEALRYFENLKFDGYE